MVLLVNLVSVGPIFQKLFPALLLFLSIPSAISTSKAQYVNNFAFSKAKNPDLNNYELDINIQPDAYIVLSTHGSDARIHLSERAKSLGFRILVHLIVASCTPGYFEIWADGELLENWSCGQTINTISANFPSNVTHVDSYEARDSYYGNPLKYWDDLDNVEITAYLNDSDDSGVYHFAANIYRDSNGSYCEGDLMPCNNIMDIQPDCVEYCAHGGVQARNIACEHDQCRCILPRLVCNGQPSCGSHTVDEDENLCQAYHQCECGRLDSTTIIIICVAWFAVLFVFCCLHWFLRKNVTFLAIFDMLMTLFLLFLWNVGIELINIRAKKATSPVGIQLAKVISTVVFTLHLVLALTLFMGFRNSRDRSTLIRYCRMYIIGNAVLLVNYQSAAIIYVIAAANQYSHLDGRLWLTALACTLRLTNMASVLHYLKNSPRPVTR